MSLYFLNKANTSYGDDFSFCSSKKFRALKRNKNENILILYAHYVSFNLFPIFLYESMKGVFCIET